MKKTYAELTEEEREVFTEEFYSLWDTYIRDDNGNKIPNDLTPDNPYPWGCPWYINPEAEYQTPEELIKENADLIIHVETKEND